MSRVGRKLLTSMLVMLIFKGSKSHYLNIINGL